MAATIPAMIKQSNSKSTDSAISSYRRLKAKVKHPLAARLLPSSASFTRFSLPAAFRPKSPHPNRLSPSAFHSMPSLP